MKTGASPRLTLRARHKNPKPGGILCYKRDLHSSSPVASSLIDLWIWQRLSDEKCPSTTILGPHFCFALGKRPWSPKSHWPRIRSKAENQQWCNSREQDREAAASCASEINIPPTWP